MDAAGGRARLFVPVWSLYAPKAVFDELWRSGDPPPVGPPDPSVVAAGLPHPISLWWGLWIGAVLGTLVAVLRLGSGPTLAMVRTGHLTQLVVDVALVVAGMLLLHLVTLTTNRQDARHTERTATPVPG